MTCSTTQMSNSCPIDEKILLIVKPTQAGKTWKTIELITSVKDPDLVNIILVDNSLLQQDQLVKRLEMYMDTEVVNHKSEVKHYSGIIGCIAQRKNTFILCQNATQRENVLQTLEHMKHTDFREEKKFQLWIDEADKNWSSVRKFVQQVNDFDTVIKTILITATPENITNYYQEVNTLLLHETHLPTFIGISQHQNIFVREMYIESTVYEYVLDTYADQIQPNTRWFIPTRKEKKSHYRAAQILKEKGFNVLVVNGDGLQLFLCDGRTIKYEKQTMEKFLLKLCEDHNLEERPFAITGYMCIERGITLMSDDFKFTHAIIPYISNNNEAYQCGGRCCGNFPNGFGNRIKIFCTQNMWNKMCTYEMAARQFAKKDKDDRTIYETRTLQDYRNAKRRLDFNDETDKRCNKRICRDFNNNDMNKLPEKVYRRQFEKTLHDAARLAFGIHELHVRETIWKDQLKCSTGQRVDKTLLKILKLFTVPHLDSELFEVELTDLQKIDILHSNFKADVSRYRTGTGKGNNSWRAGSAKGRHLHFTHDGKVLLAWNAPSSVASSSST